MYDYLLKDCTAFTPPTINLPSILEMVVDPETGAITYVPKTQDPIPSRPTWGDGNHTYMPVRMVLADAQFNSRSVVVKDEQLVNSDSTWMLIRSIDKDTDIEKMEECVLSLDPDLFEEGKEFVHFNKLDPDFILGKLVPNFSDSYNFVAGGKASDLDVYLIPVMADTSTANT